MIKSMIKPQMLCWFCVGAIGFHIVYRPAASSIARVTEGKVMLPGALFERLDSPGSIAIGHAEGNLTADGQRQGSYQGHDDPGNGRWNVGQFSCQDCRSADPRSASREVLSRIQSAAPRLQRQATAKGLQLSAVELTNGVDLLAVQAPRAGQDYIDRLKQCRSQGKRGSDAVLCARVESFRDPVTGRLQTTFRSPAALARDQQRRMTAIDRVLRSQR